MKLSPATIRTLTLPPDRGEAIYFDDEQPGFGLRLRSGGSRVYIYQYKIGAKNRRISLGAATPSSLVDMRKVASRLQAQVRLGKDPAADKAEARAQAAETFKAAADIYLGRKQQELRPQTFLGLERHLFVYAKPLHALQLAKIARRDVATVLAGVSSKSGSVTGNRLRTSLMGFFGWAMQSGLIESNPAIGTPRAKEESRARVLTPSELRVMWAALGDDDFGDIVRLLLLTGQREAEIGSLRWSEIHGDVIVLPAARVKNKQPHTVPLTAAALAVIEKRPRTERDFVFGRVAGFRGWHRCKQGLDVKIAEATGGPLPHWTIHDLRRSFATYAGGGLPPDQLQKLPRHEQDLARGLGIQPHVIEVVLNHVSGQRGGVAGVYNRGSYEAEKRTALDRWAAHLLAIVGGRASNVAPLRREA